MDDDVNLLMSEKDLTELENKSRKEAGNKRGLNCVRAHKQNVVHSTVNHWQNLQFLTKKIQTRKEIPKWKELFQHQWDVIPK